MASVTKSHFRKVAKIISDARMAVYNIGSPVDRAVARMAVYNVASELASLYREENERFDRAVFMDACGFGR